MTNLFDELKLLITELDASGVEYALCGGLSLALHGHARATGDIDILIRSEQITSAFDACSRNGYDIRGADLSFKDGAIEIRRVSKIEPDGDLISIDFILVTPEILKVWEGREAFDLVDQIIWAVSREGLIAMKRIAGRPQDVADIHALENDES
jgi:hypothetical protein